MLVGQLLTPGREASLRDTIFCVPFLAAQHLHVVKYLCSLCKFDFLATSLSSSEPCIKVSIAWQGCQEGMYPQHGGVWKGDQRDAVE